MKKPQFIIGVILTLVIKYFISWSVTMGVAWILYKLFNIPWGFKIPTGVWLLMILLDLYRQTLKM